MFSIDSTFLFIFFNRNLVISVKKQFLLWIIPREKDHAKLSPVSNRWIRNFTFCVTPENSNSMTKVSIYLLTKTSQSAGPDFYIFADNFAASATSGTRGLRMERSWSRITRTSAMLSRTSATSLSLDTLCKIRACNFNTSPTVVLCDLSNLNLR